MGVVNITYKRIILISLIFIVFFIYVFQTSFDFLSDKKLNIRINHYITSFEISSSKLSYDFNIRKSNKAYDYLIIHGDTPLSVQKRLKEQRFKSSKIDLNLNSPKNLVYVGEKRTKVTLYLRQTNTLKKIALHNSLENIHATQLISTPINSIRTDGGTIDVSYSKLDYNAFIYSNDGDIVVKVPKSTKILYNLRTSGVVSYPKQSERSKNNKIMFIKSTSGNIDIKN